MITTRARGDRRTLIVAATAAVLLLPIILGITLVIVGQVSGSVIYLPGFLLVPPGSSELITFENAQITSSRGISATANRWVVSASAVRDGTSAMTNKRYFKAGGVTFIQR